MAVAFFWLVFLSLPISFCVTAIEYEVVIDFGKDAQESEACSFPEVLKIRMKSNPPFKGSMTLRRKDEIDTDAPAYALHTDENGVTQFTEIGLRSPVKKTVAYQSLEYGAAFLVRCKNKRFQIEGTVYLDGKKYRVKAAPTHRKLTRPNKHAVLHVFTPITETGHSDQQLLNSMRERHKTYRPLKEPQWTKNDNSDRVKRATEKKKYYIDVLAIFDYAFYQFWLTQASGDANNATTMSKEYVAYMFNGINARFDTITSAVFSISVQLSGFIIATTKQNSSWTESIKEANASIPQVNANSVLINLEAWTNKTRSSFPVADVDHVMLFTGYDLYGTDNGFRFNNTAGFALVGTMCYTDGRSVSVVEDHGGYQSETTATHELGHSLGAKHDGSPNPCSSADRYVMAGEPSEETPANRRNPWQFSSCSVDYFSAHVKALGSEGFEQSCLLKKSNAKDVPTVDGLPGQRSGPDAQCRQIYGSKSYLCRGTNFGKPEDVCLSMFCRNPNTDATCTLNTAAPGTCCGNGKWCVNGQCVNATGENKCYMSETCPFGQRQGPVIGELTCDQLEAGYCYDNSNFQQVCCEMCDKKHRNATGCEYGDKVTKCNRTYCGNRDENGDLYDVQCCGTCAFTPPTTTTLVPPITTSTTTTPSKPIDDLNVCKDAEFINSTTCPSFLDKYGLLYCCKTDVRRYCCDTCTRRKSSDPTCEFGDCDPGCATTNIFQVRTIPCDDVLRTKCCKSCQNLDSRLTTKTAITTTTTTTKTAITTTTTTTTKASAIVTTAKPGAAVTTAKPGVDVTTTTKAAVTTTTTTTSTTTKAGATVTTATPNAAVTTAKPGVDVSTTKKTAVTTTTTKTSVNKPLCRPILGVRTCSGNRISANSVLALTILVMALTKVLR